jgi:3-methyladenine DNA glycosylase AlkD
MLAFGITNNRALGVAVPAIREVARAYKRNHPLALALWGTAIHEARILACFVEDPKQITAEQMEAWAADFDSWDVCDQACIVWAKHLHTAPFPSGTALAWQKARAWSVRPEEFVKRAGFSLMASLAHHAKKAPDAAFTPFFEDIGREAFDPRNFVCKAVNWALRGVGKRSEYLRGRAVECAESILVHSDSRGGVERRAARWVATDALRELHSTAIVNRLNAHSI